MVKRFALAVIGLALMIGGSWLAVAVRNADGVTTTIVRFDGAAGNRMGGMLYRPADATPENPAPAVLAVHGFINTNAQQAPFAIELARRGFVVLALDQIGHGLSAPPAFAHGYGGPDGLRYLQSLPFVDRARIAMEGHSMGGLALVAAAQDQPDGYRALALVGSSTSFDGSAPPDNLRNVLLVFGLYDEFGQLMWQTRPQDVGQSARLQALFGNSEPPVAASVITAIDDARGTRLLSMPAVTHPGEHFSNEVVTEVESWFSDLTQTRRGSGDQIWFWREIGTLIAFGGFVAFLLGVFNAIVPFFGGLAERAAPVRGARSGGWWMWLAAAALVPALLYLPAMLGGFVLTQPSAIAPQAITNHILIWAALSAAIGWLIGLTDRTKPVWRAKWAASILAAIISAALAFGVFELLQGPLPTNYGFWIFSLNAMNPWAEASFGLYLLPFAAFFLLTFRGLHHRLAVRSEGALSMYATSIAALAGGVALLCVILYVPLFVTGLLAVPIASLQAIIALQFVPVLAVCAIIGTYAYRRTNSHVPGALLSALFVTWYVTAGTATMVAPLGMGS